MPQVLKWSVVTNQVDDRHWRVIGGRLRATFGADDFAGAAAFVARIAQAIREVMQDSDTQRKFKDARLVPVVSTAEQTATMLRAYSAQWAPVVQKSGYQP